MSVASKIRQVMQKVGNLSKDKQLAEGARYFYLSEEKVTSQLHGACAEVGLVLVPVSMEILTEREDTTERQRILHNVRVLARYRFIDPDDGDVVEVCAIGEGSDLGDKVLNKCMTAALKYVLRQSFLISTGDDPDDAASEETTASRQVRRAAASPALAHLAASPGAERPVVDEAVRKSFWRLVYNDQALMTPDGEDESGREKRKPTGKFWNVISAAGLPKKYGGWTTEQYQQATAAFAAAKEGQPELSEPTEAAPGADIDDPFADQ